jgi:hypothetical protein
MNCNIGAPLDRIGEFWDAGVDKLFDRAGKALGKADEAAVGFINRVNPFGWEFKAGKFFHTDLQKKLIEVNEIFRVASNNIRNDAAKLARSLSEFAAEDRVALTRALAGDAPIETLRPEMRPLYDRLKAAISKNADDLIEAGALLPENKIEDYVKRYYEDYIEKSQAARNMLMKKTFRREETTLEERIAWGLIEDASYVIPHTIAEQLIQLQKANALKAFAERFSSAERTSADQTLIPDTSSGGGLKTYGALAGRWVDKQVKDYIDTLSVAKGDMSAMEKFLFPIIDHLKVNLTVKNPNTHIYNVLSNVFLGALHGDSLAIVKLLSMAKLDNARFKRVIETANRNGINTGLNYLENKDVKLGAKGKPNLAATIFHNLYMSKGSEVGDVMRRLYDWEDKIFKIARMNDQIEKAEAKLGRALNDKEIAAIAREANEAYINYDTPLPSAVRAIDKYGFQPFLHYTYKATPVVAKAIAKNPMKFALMQIAFAGLGMSAWFNENDEELKPSWAANQFNLLGVKEWTELPDGAWLNSGRFVPGIRFLPDIDWSWGFMGTVKNLLEGEDSLGRKVSGKYDSVPDKITDRLTAAGETFLPPMTFGRYGQRSLAALFGAPRKNYYGRDMGMTEIFMRGLGVRYFNSAADLQARLDFAKAEFNAAKKEADGDRAKIARAQEKYNKRVADIKEQAAKHNVTPKALPKDKKPSEATERGFGAGGVYRPLDL